MPSWSHSPSKQKWNLMWLRHSNQIEFEHTPHAIRIRQFSSILFWVSIFVFWVPLNQPALHISFLLLPSRIPLRLEWIDICGCVESNLQPTAVSHSWAYPRGNFTAPTPKTVIQSTNISRSAVSFCYFWFIDNFHFLMIFSKCESIVCRTDKSNGYNNQLKSSAPRQKQIAIPRLDGK